MDGKYRLYLNYIQHVGETCGFTVEEDILRIPSTKRVRLVLQALSIYHQLMKLGEGTAVSRRSGQAVTVC